MIIVMKYSVCFKKWLKDLEYIKTFSSRALLGHSLRSCPGQDLLIKITEQSFHLYVQ